MYKGERHINSEEAMHHNQQVEQARQAEHLRRCAESPAYKRVYERSLKISRDAVQTLPIIQQTISDQMRQQTAQTVNDSMKPRFVKLKDHPGPVLPSDVLKSLAGCGNPFLWFLIGLMFTDTDQLRLMREDVVAIQEMNEVNEQYDRQMILMSGFEW